jgi:hypothetical protein
LTLLDDALPDYDFRERHARRIAAPPERVDRAVRAVTIDDMPLARLLFAIRATPGRLHSGTRRSRPKDVPLLEYALRLGFGPLGDRPADEIAVGMIGQPWKLTGGEWRLFEEPGDFSTFAEPGFVKAAMNFRVEAAGQGTLLTTETRILATDPLSRRRFRRYWFVIRAGSGLTRLSWLRAAERRAYAGSPSK